MNELVQHVAFLVVGITWAWLGIIQILIRLLVDGPKKLFHKKDPSGPPALLSDPVYGQHSYINIGPIKLHYVVSGPDQAPLMLFLHGFPEIWYSWRYQIKEFQKDFRVVAVDMRGFGDSDKPVGVDQYKMPVLVEDVRLLIEALGYKKCVLVSHDWGGSVAYAVAASHPDMIERLVVMNIPPISIWRDGFTTLSQPVQFLASGYIYLFQLPYFPEFNIGLGDFAFLEMAFLGKKFGVRSGIMTSEDVECYKYFLRKPGAVSPGINYYRANLGVPGLRHHLKYPMPVQIIWGCQDTALTLNLLDDISKAIPHADVTRIEEASHWVQMDQPEKVNQSIRKFLQSTRYNASK
uniref:AB hydrolase-1 domain-containing protein n=1 Tax=Arion vulgaris TaxID=1028688 RepID=A0A0B6YQU2_9EUPU